MVAASAMRLAGILAGSGAVEPATAFSDTGVAAEAVRPLEGASLISVVTADLESLQEGREMAVAQTAAASNTVEESFIEKKNAARPEANALFWC